MYGHRGAVVCFVGMIFGLLAFRCGGLSAQDAAPVPQEYAAPVLGEEGAWSVIVVPDPQTYNKFSRNQGIFELMTAWIADNREKLNIQLVLVTGDLVERNGVHEAGKRKDLDQTSEQQWAAARRALGRLTDVVPCVVCPGNHDFGVETAENRESQLDTYFPKDWSSVLTPHLVECGDNSFGKKTLENAAYQFVMPGDRKVLVVSLEFAPSDRAIEWAKSVISRAEFADHEVWVLTHSYIASNGKHIDKESYQVADANYGKALWEKLVKISPNIRFVVCGHIAHPDSWEGSVAFSTETNDAGRPVQQMLFDTQALGGGWHGNGGDGWLRILEFSPDGKTVRAKTFSPLFGISPTTRQHAWQRTEFNEFSFELQP